MNWDAVGAIAEILGSITVISTLFYLALQVKHARDQIRTSVRESRNTAARELQLSVIQNPQLVRVMGKAYAGWTTDIGSEEQFYEAAEFTFEDQIIWASYMRVAWTYFRESIRHIPELMPSQLEELHREIMANYSKGPGKLYLDSMSAIDSQALKYVRELVFSNENSIDGLRSSVHHPEA